MPQITVCMPQITLFMPETPSFICLKSPWSHASRVCGTPQVLEPCTYHNMYHVPCTYHNMHHARTTTCTMHVPQMYTMRTTTCTMHAPCTYHNMYQARTTHVSHTCHTYEPCMYHIDGSWVVHGWFKGGSWVVCESVIGV